MPVEPAAQMGAAVETAGPSRLLVVPADHVEATTSTSGRGVLRLRESVESEADERPSTRAHTRGQPQPYP